MRTHNATQHSRTFTGATNAQHMAPNPMTVSEALKSEITAYVRSGAVDACECCMMAMEQVATRFRLTFRQTEELFTRLA